MYLDSHERDTMQKTVYMYYVVRMPQTMQRSERLTALTSLIATMVVALMIGLVFVVKDWLGLVPWWMPWLPLVTLLIVFAVGRWRFNKLWARVPIRDRLTDMIEEIEAVDVGREEHELLLWLFEAIQRHDTDEVIRLLDTAQSSLSLSQLSFLQDVASDCVTLS